MIALQKKGNKKLKEESDCLFVVLVFLVYEIAQFY